MNDHANHESEIPTHPTDESGDDAMIEECIEELEGLLDRYPPAAVAVALGTHFKGSLGVLLDEGICTADEVRENLREIESEVLKPHGPADR